MNIGEIVREVEVMPEEIDPLPEPLQEPALEPSEPAPPAVPIPA